MRVEYHNTITGAYKSAKMKCPKRVTDINAWLKSARKAIPEIPEMPIAKWDANTREVRIFLSLGDEYATIRIDRTITAPQS